MLPEDNIASRTYGTLSYQTPSTPVFCAEREAEVSLAFPSSTDYGHGMVDAKNHTKMVTLAATNMLCAVQSQATFYNVL